MLKSRQSLKEQFYQGYTVSDEILKLIYFKFKTDSVLVKRARFFCQCVYSAITVIMVMVLDRIKRMNNAKKWWSKIQNIIINIQ